jgi:PAS domain-containing protein
MISIALPSPLMACVAGTLIAAGALAHRRTRAKIRSLSDAFDHMSQGLCMFDAAGRIIVCNQPYLRMYRLSPEVVKPGCTLRALIEHRRQTGLFTGDPAQYCKDIMRHRGRHHLEMDGECQRRPHRARDQCADAGRRLGIHA